MIKSKINKLKKTKKEVIVGVNLATLFFVAISLITFVSYSEVLKKQDVEKVDIITNQVSTSLKNSFERTYAFSRQLFYSENFQMLCDIDTNQNVETYKENLSNEIQNFIDMYPHTTISGAGFMPYKEEVGYINTNFVYKGNFNDFEVLYGDISSFYFKEMITQSSNQENKNGKLFITKTLDNEIPFYCFARNVMKTYSTPFHKKLGIGYILISRNLIDESLALFDSIHGLEGYVFDNERNIFGETRDIKDIGSNYLVTRKLLDVFDYELISLYNKNVVYYHVLPTVLIIFLLYFVLLSLFIFVYAKYRKRYRKSIDYLFNSFLNTSGLEHIQITNDDVDVDKVLSAYNSMIDNVLEEKKINDDLSLKNKKIEISALNSQINKHFIINILSVIHSLINLQKFETTNYCIEILSDFLRYSLSLNVQEVEFKNEINQIDNYLKLQMIRYDGIQVEFDIDNKLLNIIVPKMTLQPLVENAFVHGLKDKKGKIKIFASTIDDVIVIKVHNSGKFDESKIKEINNKILSGEESISLDGPNHGLALININKRLKLLYGSNVSLRLKIEDDGISSIIEIKKEGCEIC